MPASTKDEQDSGEMQCEYSHFDARFRLIAGEKTCSCSQCDSNYLLEQSAILQIRCFEANDSNGITVCEYEATLSWLVAQLSEHAQSKQGIS